MIPTVRIGGKTTPFPPILHLHQLGMVEVVDSANGVSRVVLTEEGEEEAKNSKRILQTVEHLKTFNQLELV